MTKFDEKKGSLKCEFDANSKSARLLDAKGQEIATSPILEKPLLDKVFGVKNHYEGDSVMKPLPSPSGNNGLDMYNMAVATKNDGFDVLVGKSSAADKKDGSCDVDLVDGRKFKDVPMFKTNGPSMAP